jgi:small-conductance mechanosensitive channel
MIERIVREPFFLWAVGLILLTPLVIIILGELIAALERRKSPYVAFWRYLRHGVLPLAIALLIAQYVLLVPVSSSTLLLLQTLFWLILGVTALVLVQGVTNAGVRKERWEASIPGLFTAVARALVIFVPLYYILSGVWGVDLSNLVTALGIGSLVIALALQDTLSNLVSGLLLLADKPFATGDWIEIEGHTGKVLDLNWRSVRLQVRGRDVLVIPNSVLSNSSIYNYTTIDPSYREHIAVGFSYDDPPNKVKRMLLEAAAGSDQVLTKPPPTVLTVSYDDSSIGYELVVYVKEYRSPFSRLQLRDEILTRVYYGAQRAGINIPFPIRTLYHFDGERPDTAAKRQEILGYLQPNFYFATLDEVVLEHVAGGATLQSYGRQETVVTAGRPAAALFLIVRGRADLSAVDGAGAPQSVDRLGPGDLFGESVLLGNRPSTMTVHALDDLTVVRVPSAMINEVVERNPRFALALDELVEERLRIVRALREKSESQPTAGAAVNGKVG